MAELWLEFPEFKVEKFTILATVLAEICVTEVAGLHQPKPGTNGTVE